ncbi:MAG: DNA-binding response regulator [Chloroflexi bacterium]|nr:MAG: DNA-binding response regulator [Chloroflexota bacterium]
MEVVKVLLVDDHEVVRLGLMTLLEDVPWVQVVGEVGTAEEAVTAVSTHTPDVILMDIRLPGNSGIDACREITAKWPVSHVIMLTSYADNKLILQALQAGACCYVLKQVGNEALIEALNKVRRGEALLDPAETKQTISKFRQQARDQQGNVFKDFTERELNVLAQISQGKTNPQIAVALSVAEQTVCNDMNDILAKLNLSNRFEAAIFALHHNINFHLPERDKK